MKGLLSTFVLAAVFFATGNAQTSLVGRVYYHPNVMAEGMKAHEKEIPKKMEEAVDEEVAKAEKKKGRALTAEEKAKVRKEAEEAARMGLIIMKGTTTALTVTFKSETEMEMKMNLKVDEDALKEAGIGWAKRKLLKSAIAVMPSTEKMKYELQDNLVICIDGKDRDTLTISADGKHLTGKTDEGTRFKLTRQK